MTRVDLNATPAGVPQPVLRYSGDLRVPHGAQSSVPARYPVEVWEVANGDVYAVVTDVYGNTSLANASERIAAAIRAQWTDVRAIYEYWPDGFFGDAYRLSAEDGGSYEVNLTSLSRQGFVLKP